MIIPPVTPEYDTAAQAILNDVLIKSDQQNFKLDQDKKAPSQCKALYKYLLDKGYYNKLDVRTQ